MLQFSALRSRMRWLFLGLLVLAATAATHAEPQKHPAAVAAALDSLYPAQAHGVRGVLALDLNRDGRQDWVVLVGLRSGAADPSDSFSFETERLVVFQSRPDGSLSSPLQSGDLVHDRRGWTEVQDDGGRCFTYQHYNSGSASSHSSQRFEFCMAGRELLLTHLYAGSEDSCCEDYPKEASAEVWVRQGRLERTDMVGDKAKKRRLRFKPLVIHFEGFAWDGYENVFPESVRSLIP